MDENLKRYVESADYLPDVLKDFHDQKLLFKRLGEIVKNRKDGYTDNVSWTAGQVYTIDVFLYYMAVHGYTLQRSRKQVDFENIDEDLHAFEATLNKSKADMLKSLFANTE